jgi:dihydrofolate synthase/folylpolyglutamate synthase
MKSARLPGRFEIISGSIPEKDALAIDWQGGVPKEDAPAVDGQGGGEPFVILDGAHNPAGVAALRAAVNALLPDTRILALISMMRDKQTDVILKEIQCFACEAVFTETSNGRSMHADELASQWLRHKESAAPDAGKPAEQQQARPVTAIRDPREAYEAARAMVASGEYDALIVTGSLYLISDLISEGIEQ